MLWITDRLDLEIRLRDEAYTGISSISIYINHMVPPSIQLDSVYRGNEA